LKKNYTILDYFRFMELNNYILYAFGVSAQSYVVDFDYKILSTK